MVNKEYLNEENYLDLLNKCIIIRNMLLKDKIENMLIYKYKEYKCYYKI